MASVFILFSSYNRALKGDEAASRECVNEEYKSEGRNNTQSNKNGRIVTGYPTNVPKND